GGFADGGRPAQGTRPTNRRPAPPGAPTSAQRHRSHAGVESRQRGGRPGPLRGRAIASRAAGRGERGTSGGAARFAAWLLPARAVATAAGHALVTPRQRRPSRRGSAADCAGRARLDAAKVLRPGRAHVAAPAELGPMDRQPRPSADRARYRQSRLATTLWRGARADAERLRQKRRSADASRIARLAGRLVRGPGLVAQEAAL